MIIHLEVSILLFTFAPVMLGQASAIKVRNQVSEYPPLSKLAGCFFVPRYGVAKIRNISEIHNEKDSFLLIFDNMTFHNRCYKVIAPVTFSLSAYYIIGRNNYLCTVESWRIMTEDYFF